MEEAENARRPVIVDVAGIGCPSPDDVDRLARMQLAAHRRGCRVELANVGPDLGAFLALSGLGEVLGLAAGRSDPQEVLVDPHRQPEQREQPLDVEVVADVDDRPG
jgi:hypothetical protein